MRCDSAMANLKAVWSNYACSTRNCAKIKTPEDRVWSVNLSEKRCALSKHADRLIEPFAMALATFSMRFRLDSAIDQDDS